jgi:spermidine synthase
MTEITSEPYQDWWHEASSEIGLTNAFALQKVHTVTTSSHKLELYTHHLFGRLLVMDGCLYSIEHDPGYREMLIHVPLLGRRHKDCRVLMLGSDGVLLREILRHEFVTEVVVCESEPALLELEKEWLGHAEALADARVKLFSHTAEIALAAVEKAAQDFALFDLIVLCRPAAQAALSPQSLAACLTDGGVCVDSDWLVLGKKQNGQNGQQGWLREMTGTRNSLLRSVTESAAFQTIQSYCGLSPWMTGYRGFFLYTKDAHSYAEPCVPWTGTHYNADLHRAAFLLPTFWPAHYAMSKHGGISQ